MVMRMMTIMMKMITTYITYDEVYFCGLVCRKKRSVTFYPQCFYTSDEVYVYHLFLDWCVFRAERQRRE